LSRHQAERERTLAEHIADTTGVDCRKDEGVIDESPLPTRRSRRWWRRRPTSFEIVHPLKQVVCVTG
jgi:tRNA-splicing ligase RtcB